MILDTRVALVTGGASGIGVGIAEMLAEAGATVVIADIDAARAQEVADQIASTGGKAGCVQLDLADEASVVCACAETVERFGSPWVLVNNAGLQDREMLLDGTAAEWDRTLAVNARGPFLLICEVARAMVAAGDGGRIVNILSAAVIGSLTKGHAAYASSKNALLGLTWASALELVEHRITVNTVLPGGVMTRGGMLAKGPIPDGPAMRVPPPLGMCEPRDIGAGRAVLRLPAAQRVTNQRLAVDGGWSIS